MEEKELTKLEKDITSYYDDVRQNEERIRYLQEKLGKKEIEESEWIRQKEELADIKQQIKELDSSILLLTHQIETMTKDLAKKEELEQKWETESHKKDMIKELEQLFKGNAFIDMLHSQNCPISPEKPLSSYQKYLAAAMPSKSMIPQNLSSGIIKMEELSALPIPCPAESYLLPPSPWHWRSPLPSSLMAPLLSNSSS